MLRIVKKMAASVNTLDGLIREMKIRFPDAAACAPPSPEMVRASRSTTGSWPAIVGERVGAAR